MVQSKSGNGKSDSGNGISGVSSIVSNVGSFVASSTPSPVVRSMQALEPYAVRAATSVASTTALSVAKKLHISNPSFVQAVTDSRTAVLNNGSLLRRPKEFIHECIYPISDNASHYSLLPLPTSIRLLTIHPGNAGSKLRCSLHTVDLEDGPEYKALSYSWMKDQSPIQKYQNLSTNGFIQAQDFTEAILDTEESSNASKETPRAILCNGKPMKVYPNLYDALIQLRSSSSGDYWIDAVCINQGDNIERNSQVQLMSRIYSSAASVTVWLGTCPYVLSTPTAWFVQQGDNLTTKASVSDQSQSEGEKPHFALILMAVVYLIRRRYFSRLWVIQEFCLAKSINIYLAEHCISPQRIMVLVDMLVEESHKQDNAWDMVQYGIFLRVLTETPLPRLLHTGERLRCGDKLTIEEWLALSWSRGASDSRDFVNAGLALIKPEDLVIRPTLHNRSEKEALELWSELHVDYEASATEALRNFAACILSKPGGIRLLSFSARIRNELCIDADYAAVRVVEQSGKSVLPTTPAKVAGIALHLYRAVLSELSGTEADHEMMTMPSWIPNPGSWSSNIESFSSQGIKTCVVCTTVDNNPTISSDGTTLYIDAAKLSVVERVCHNPIDANQLALLEFALALPPNFTKTESGLQALANTLLAGTWQGSEKEALEGLVDLIKSGKSHQGDQVDHWWKKRRMDEQETRPKVVQLVKKSKDAWGERKSLRRAYEALETNYPEIPWRNMDSQEVSLRFAKDSERFGEWRSVFSTQNDKYLGLGPSWLEEGDQVMLVRGAHLPYIFRHVDQILAGKCRLIEKELADRKSSLAKAERDQLQTILGRTQGQMGKKDAWVLIGEAYVRGSMEGCAMARTTEFHRIALV